jgi:hypothetical protein
VCVCVCVCVFVCFGGALPARAGIGQLLGVKAVMSVVGVEILALRLRFCSACFLFAYLITSDSTSR